ELAELFVALSSERTFFDRRNQAEDRIDRSEAGPEHAGEVLLLAEQGTAAIRTNVAAVACDEPVDREPISLELRAGGACGFEELLHLLRAELGATLVAERQGSRSALGELGRLVCAEALLAHQAVNERIFEVGEVPTRLPDARVHDDARLEADNIFTTVNHEGP